LQKWDLHFAGTPDSIGHCFEPLVCFACLEPQVLNHWNYRETLPGWQKRIDLPEGMVVIFRRPGYPHQQSKGERQAPERRLFGRGVPRNATKGIFLAFDTGR
jgi:hypothetical protein